MLATRLLFWSCVAVASAKIIKQVTVYDTIEDCQAGDLSRKIFSLPESKSGADCKLLETLPTAGLMSAIIQPRFTSDSELSFIRCEGVDDCSASCVLENVACGSDCAGVGGIYYSLECSASGRSVLLVLAIAILCTLAF